MVDGFHYLKQKPCVMYREHVVPRGFARVVHPEQNGSNDVVLDARAFVVAAFGFRFDIDGDVVGLVWLAEELDCEDVVLHVA